jgi:diguanylate cyclase (GGDEF)-like protein
VSYHALLTQSRLHAEALASVTATQAQAPLLFRDRAAAAEILRALPGEEGVSEALLLDRTGATLAATANLPDASPVSAIARLMDKSVSREIVVDGQHVGTLRLKYGGAPLAQSVVQLIGLMLLTSALISVFVLGIARRLAARITAPLTELEAVIRSARESGDLSRRAPPCEIAEIERLAADFHGLLGDVANREADLARTYKVLERLATQDPLTGLANRAMLESRLLERADADRATSPQAGLLYFDLDSFKAVNDTLGHAVGDELLRSLASRLRSVLPHDALPTRIGGDEFVVLLPDATDLELQRHAQATQAAIEAPLEIGEWTFEPAISVGVATASNSSEDLGTLLDRADRAMYLAKKARRGEGRRTRWTAVHPNTRARDPGRQGEGMRPAWTRGLAVSRPLRILSDN